MKLDAGIYMKWADFLDSTEEYLKKAIQCYRSKYGVCTAIDNYVIYFEPVRSYANDYNKLIRFSVLIKHYT